MRAVIWGIVLSISLEGSTVSEAAENAFGIRKILVARASDPWNVVVGDKILNESTATEASDTESSPEATVSKFSSLLSSRSPSSEDGAAAISEGWVATTIGPPLQNLSLSSVTVEVDTIATVFDNAPETTNDNSSRDASNFEGALLNTEGLLNASASPTSTVKASSFSKLENFGIQHYDYSDISYIGCYRDQFQDRDLPHYYAYQGYLTLRQCYEQALVRKDQYFGLQAGDPKSGLAQCFTGSDYGRYGQADVDQCPKSANGPNYFVGGEFVNAVYKATAPEEYPICNSTKGCNVCQDCCQDFIADGAKCAECTAIWCPSPPSPPLPALPPSPSPPSPPPSPPPSYPPPGGAYPACGGGTGDKSKCNVCDTCCQPWISEGEQCLRCYIEACPLKCHAINWHPEQDCNVCASCCRDFIIPEKCGACASKYCFANHNLTVA